MPDLVTPPAASPSPVSTDAAAGQPSPSRDRFAQLVSQREDFRKARDQAVSALAQFKSDADQKDQAIKDLRATVDSLKATIEGMQSKPKTPWADYASTSEDQLVSLMTSGGVDPVTGQPTPPNPASAARAQYELNERRARQIADEIVARKMGELTNSLSAKDAAREEAAKAERRLMAVYGAELNDPKSSLRQTAEQLLDPFKNEFGQPYAQSPIGIQHLFSESQRILLSDENSRLKKDNEILRGRLARQTGGAYGPGGAPVPVGDDVKEALKTPGKQGVREAIRRLKTFQAVAGPPLPTA